MMHVRGWQITDLFVLYPVPGNADLGIQINTGEHLPAVLRLHQEKYDFVL